MITTEQWILELSEQSQLAQASCKQLWGELTSLLIGRLSQGLATYMRSVGLWTVETEAATIALLPSGERHLMPPRSIPRLFNQEQPLSAEEVGDLLTKAAEQIPQTIQSFYKSVSELFEMHERLGHTLEWSPLGSFAPQHTADEGVTSYAFTPADTLLKHINRPFEMFTPTRLKEGVCWTDIEERSVTTIQEAYAPVISSRRAEGTGPSEQTATPPPYQPVKTQGESLPTPPPFLPSNGKLEDNTLTTETGPSDSAKVIPTPPPFKGREAGQSQSLPSTGTASASPSITHIQPQEDSIVERPRAAHRHRRSAWLWVVIPVVVLLVAILLWLFLFKGRDSHPISPVPSTPRTTVPAVVAPHLDIDTITTVDSVTPPADTPRKVEILTTVTLEPGDYLARYARRYLGRGEYWIYIYLVNEERIDDPDNIPLGTQIEIPTPQSVGLTGDEEADLARAKQLISDYHNKKAAQAQP